VARTEKINPFNSIRRFFMKRCMSVAVMWMCTSFLFFISAPASVHAGEETIKLRYSNFFPPVHAISKLSEEWCKEIEKRTNGRVKIIYFPGATLTPPMQTYDSTVKGIADIGQALLAYAPGRLPLSGVLALPLGYKNGYQATKLANAYYKKFHPKEFDDVEVMYLHGAAPALFYTKKPVTSMDGIKGLRIKASAESASIVSAVGGVPVTQPITETYDSLQKGLVEGVVGPIEILQGWRFAEVVKGCLEDYGISYMTSMFVVMNKAKWNSISKGDQEIIKKINDEWIEKQGKLWIKLDEDSKAYSLSKGVEWVKVSPEEEAKTAEKMKSVRDKYVEEMKAKDLPGAEALKFCQEYIKSHP
jgi:TRAP-type C4-dicarboxylate transport system substrate-binding protein